MESFVGKPISWGVFIVAYWLIPNKMKTWLRVLISAAVSLTVVALVRLICY